MAPKPARARPDTQARTRELGAPVVVAARYPQELLARIDAARGPTARQTWLVEAARQRLESDALQDAAAAELAAARARAKTRRETK